MSFKEKYNNLNRRTDKYSFTLDRLFKSLNKEISTIIEISGIKIDTCSNFNLNDFPEIKNKINKVFKTFFKDYQTIISSSIEIECKIANADHNKWLKKINKKFTSVKQKHNLTAKKYFQIRTDSGMNLSTKVWNLTEQTKTIIESTLSLGLKKGTSAVELAKKLNESLYNPRSLLKNWKETFEENKKEIKDARYNAQRLMRTEVNMAYRTAENTRWRDEDFILGYEVKLSKNHNCKGVPNGDFFDICDQLQGIYPKSFKFVGWHPQCRCYAVPILPSTEEMAEYINNDMPDGYFDNKKIDNMPDNFKNWYSNNEDRILKAKERGTLPYFIKDNEKFIDDLLNKKSRIEENRQLYERLKNDPNYYDVEFNPKNGGLKATHITHNFDKKKGDYERNSRDIGFQYGHSIILENEPSNVYKKKSCEGTWDNLKFEIAGAENGTPNNIRNALKHCAKKPDSQIAVLYFTDKFSHKDFFKGFSLFNGLPDNQYKHFKTIYCIKDGEIIYSINPINKKQEF